MPPHNQVLLEQARVTRRLTSRRWVAAHSHVANNNLLLGAVPTKYEVVMPRGVVHVVNVDELIDATWISREAEQITP
jgi:hypothetical protein